MFLSIIKTQEREFFKAFLLKISFLFFSVCVYVYERVHVSPRGDLKRALDPLEVDLHFGCELPNVGTGNQMLVLWQEQQVLSHLST